MADLRRRPWTEADNRALIDLWPRVGSIVLIALELQRSSSSVQTQASRLGLPRRTEGRERHRRKWTPADVASLESSVAARTGADGTIPICEIAEDVGRSIDAVSAKLAESIGSEEALFRSIKVTRRNYLAVPAEPPKPSAGIDPRKVGKKRPCMCCSKIFWSEGAHNRLCAACKKDEGGSDWDW